MIREGAQGSSDLPDLRDLPAIHTVVEHAVLCGETDLARAILKDYEVQARDLPCDILADWFRIELAWANLLAGNLPEAWAVVRGIPHLVDAPFWNDIEASDAAVSGWESTIRESGVPSQQQFLSRLYVCLGRLCASEGRYRDALVFLDRSPVRTGDVLSVAYEVVAEAGFGTKPDGYDPGWSIRAQIECFDADAGVLWNQAELGSSLIARERSWSVSTKNEVWAAALRSGLALANTLLDLGQFDRCRPVLERTLTLASVLADPLAELRCRRLRVRLDTLAAHQALPNALSIAEVWAGDVATQAGPGLSLHILPLRATASFAVWQSDCLTHLEGLIAAGDIDSAYRTLGAIRNEFGRSDSLLLRLRLHYARALVLHADQRSAQAARILQRLMRIFRKSGMPMQEFEALRLLGRCAPLSLHACGDRIWKIAKRAAHSLGRVDRWMWESTLADDRDLWLSAKLEALPLHAFARVVRFLHQISREQEAFYHQLAFVRPDEEKGWQRLDPGATGNALLSMVCLRNQLLLVLLFRDQQGRIVHRARVVRVERVQLLRIITVLHREFQAVFLDPEKTLLPCKSLLDQLAEALGIPEIIADLPVDTRVLEIHAGGALATIPFAALPVEGSPLIRRLAVTVRPMLTRLPHVAPHAGRNALLAAVQHGAPGFPAPAGVNNLDWLRKSEVLSGSAIVEPDDNQLSREWLSEALPRAEFFHFAGHGTFDIDNSERTGLVLVPEPGKIQIFSLSDIARLRLRLRFACLVSCEIGDVYQLPSGWSAGIVHGLLRCGAQQVLASLWPTTVEFASEAIPVFYSFLSSNSPEQALRLFQLHCLAKGLDVTQWSGWQLFRRSQTWKDRVAS